MRTTIWTRAILVIAPFYLVACEVGNELTADPTERGLSYIAGAIITAALIRGFLHE